MKILSWNVNGIRACGKCILEIFKNECPDVLCLQEIKATPDKVAPHIRHYPGYHIYWKPAERKGYSGVVTYSKTKPLDVKTGFGIEKFDSEGRILITTFKKFTLFNIYFPNGKRDSERLDYKLKFYDTFLDYADELKLKNTNIVVCGDFNTAHKEVDIARPKENQRISGFLPVERAWMDRLVDHGYVDTFRYFNKEPNQYTWWDTFTKARERNVGWRIDYFFVNKEFMPCVKKAFIMPNVMDSDHCPVGIELEV